MFDKPSSVARKERAARELQRTILPRSRQNSFESKNSRRPEGTEPPAVPDGLDRRLLWKNERTLVLLCFSFSFSLVSVFYATTEQYFPNFFIWKIMRDDILNLTVFRGLSVELGRRSAGGNDEDRPSREPQLEPTLLGSDLPIYGVMFIDCAYPLSQLA